MIQIDEKVAVEFGLHTPTMISIFKDTAEKFGNPIKLNHDILGVLYPYAGRSKRSMVLRSLIRLGCLECSIDEKAVTAAEGFTITYKSDDLFGQMETTRLEQETSI